MCDMVMSVIVVVVGTTTHLYTLEIGVSRNVFLQFPKLGEWFYLIIFGFELANRTPCIVNCRTSF